MSNTKAFTKVIKKSSSDSHQSSPGYVLTFIRWSNRDTVNYEGNKRIGDNNITRPTMVVINDAITISVNDSKNQLTPQATVVLKGGDINYGTAIGTGDYMLINLLDYRDRAVDIAIRASNNQSINKYSYGFKGLFKVQSVRRQLVTDPSTGRKSLNYVVHGFGFTEFNSLIYYNPALTKKLTQSNSAFLTEFKGFADLATAFNNADNVGHLLRIVIKKIFTVGLNKSDSSVELSPNRKYYVPPPLGSLLGRPNAKVISDIYNFIFGIWDKSVPNAPTISAGFNPNVQRRSGDETFYEVKGGNKANLQGYKMIQIQDFNQKNIWSILNTYLNSAINESYTVSGRVDINGNIIPTVIFRQKPFSSLHFDNPNNLNGVKNPNKPASKIPHTPFLKLPRWKISSDLIYNMDLGKDDAARINMVYLRASAVAVNPTVNEAIQATNIFYDPEDIRRHGLKAAMLYSPFDYSKEDGELQKSKNWSYLLFDMLNGGQLREGGGLNCVGIEEPISVGDNLEFDSNVYHIEQVQHSMTLQSDGKYAFRTNLKLTFGTSIYSTDKKPVYPQMEYTDAYTERIRDEKTERILPGIGDTQDLPTAPKQRQLGEEVKETPESSFTLDATKKQGRARLSTIHYKEEGERSENPNKDTKK